MTNNLVAEATSLLCDMIRIPSVSRNEGDVAAMVAAFLQGKGVDCRRCLNNVVAIDPRFDGRRKTLLLCAHLDTVRPVDGWQRNPFEPVREGDRIYGLGSNDDGASVVSLVAAFRALTRSDVGYNLVLLLSAEEEISGANGVEHVLPLLPHIDAGLVGEPTGMRPATAEKGLMVLDVVTNGVAGHAARGNGVNAIYRAMPDLEWLRTHRFERVSPLLGAVRMTVTGIQAGTQHNVIPDRCQMLVDVRSNELYTNRELFSEIAGALQSDVRAHSFRLNASGLPLAHPLAARAAEVCGKPFGSPTLSDQALMPFPTLKLGPGQSARSHTADEYVCAAEVEQGIAQYIELLKGLRL